MTTYGYDLQDHLASVKDAEGNVTTYAYSGRGLLIQQTSPVSGVTTHQYDDHGELIAETGARGITGEGEVDALGRVVLVDYPDDTLDTTYTYDDPAVLYSKGLLTAIARQGSTVPYTYDRIGNRLSDASSTYTYTPNSLGGRTPKLSRIEPVPEDEPGTTSGQGRVSPCGPGRRRRRGAVCSLCRTG